MLITFLIFAGCVLLVLFYLLWLLWPDTRAVTTVPGLSAVNLSLGNLSNIRDAGSLPKFLTEMHQEHGPIASFWLGQYLCVSLGQANYIKMVDSKSTASNIYETALPLLSELLLGDTDSEPTSLISTKSNYLLTNFQPFIKRSFDKSELESLVQELIQTWKSMGPDDHLPATEYMNALATKLYARLVLNDRDHFTNNQNVGALLSAFSALSSKIEEMQSLSLTGSDPDILVENLNTRVEQFMRVIQQSQSNSVDTKSSAAQTFSEISSIGSLLSWSLHYCSLGENLSQALRKGDRSVVMKALREVYRLTALVPYRCKILQEEMNILGHTLDKGTVLFSAHSAVFWNADLFPSPDSLELERENTDIPSPLQAIKGLNGDSFVMTVVAEVLVKLLNNFDIRPAFSGDHPGFKFGLTCRPQSEVWINLEKRN